MILRSSLFIPVSRKTSDFYHMFIPTYYIMVKFFLIVNVISIFEILLVNTKVTCQNIAGKNL
jgi:hypothetical protein